MSLEDIFLQLTTEESESIPSDEVVDNTQETSEEPENPTDV